MNFLWLLNAKEKEGDNEQNTFNDAFLDDFDEGRLQVYIHLHSIIRWCLGENRCLIIRRRH